VGRQALDRHAAAGVHDRAFDLLFSLPPSHPLAAALLPLLLLLLVVALLLLLLVVDPETSRADSGPLHLQDFDTGSSDLWVPGKGVSGFTTFDSSQSSTVENSTDSFQISYGDGSSVSGPVYTDTVTVAGLSAVAQHFSAVSNMGTDFGATPVDGILGLGFETISNLGERPFFKTLWEEGHVSQNLFSFVLGDADDGELYLGGLDNAKYSGELTYTPVTQAGCASCRFSRRPRSRERLELTFARLPLSQTGRSRAPQSSTASSSQVSR